MANKKQHMIKILMLVAMMPAFATANTCPHLEEGAVCIDRADCGDRVGQQ